MRGRSLGVAAAAVLGLSLVAVPGAQSAFPGANGEIAFSAVLPSGIGDGPPSIDICAVDPADGARLRVTPSGLHSATWFVDPAWSPDGRRLLITVPDPYGTFVGVAGLDGDVEPLIRWAESPAWNPDGLSFAYALAAGGIGVGTVGGSSRTLRPGSAFWPSWSPDGRRIAFVESGRLALMNADGSGFDPLTTGSDQISSPSWSPDGGRLAFVSRETPTAAPLIEVIDADGGNRTLLRRVRSFQGRRGAGDVDPTWSPDGTRIAFVQLQESGQATDVYTMAADGSDLRNVTRSPFSEFGIDWRRLGELGALPHSDSTCGVGGSNAADRLTGSDDSDVVLALRGADVITTGAGEDLVYAGSGSDTMRLGAHGDFGLGEGGDDRVQGEGGNDELFGGPGRDRVVGGPGMDWIGGGPGDDILDARDRGRDEVSCGGGRDVVYADWSDKIPPSDCERIFRR